VKVCPAPPLPFSHRNHRCRELASNCAAIGVYVFPLLSEAPVMLFVAGPTTPMRNVEPFCVAPPVALVATFVPVPIPLVTWPSVIDMAYLYGRFRVRASTQTWPSWHLVAL
jgi:hypothetical protein